MTRTQYRLVRRLKLEPDTMTGDELQAARLARTKLQGIVLDKAFAKAYDGDIAAARFLHDVGVLRLDDSDNV